jgi:hypothetical protein
MALELHRAMWKAWWQLVLWERNDEKQRACGSVNSGGDRKLGQVVPALLALPSVGGTDQISGSKIKENFHETQPCMGNA